MGCAEWSGAQCSARRTEATGRDDFLRTQMRPKRLRLFRWIHRDFDKERFISLKFLARELLLLFISISPLVSFIITMVLAANENLIVLFPDLKCIICMICNNKCIYFIFLI
jgi:hypothetical protein